MKQYFELDDDLVYLNHAAVSPWPKQTAVAVRAFADENAREGSKHYLRWVETETNLRQQLATLINAPSNDEIALLKSTSEGLSFIAGGIRWQKGDNVVVPHEEFPSNHLVWSMLENKGVEVRSIPIIRTEDPERRLIAAMDEDTRLLSCSSVQYSNGLRLDLEQLGAACKDDGRDILFCVDAIQSLGALAFDVQRYRADFVVADGHKWMMGPEGLALFYCRQALIEELELNEFGWHMMETPGDFSKNNTQFSRTASRFECGSPNMLATHALSASLDVVSDVGIDEIEQRVLSNTQYLIDALSAIDGCHILSPTESKRRSGIVTFRIDDVDSNHLYSELMANDVICAARGGGVRLSPHFYTETRQIDEALNRLRSIINT